MATDSYIIKGGIEGFERLKVLSRVMHGVTCSLFERVGVGASMHCLDAGCGSGDVTFELARRVGKSGRVVGIDLDDVKLDLARKEALATGATVELRRADVTELAGAAEFDLIYARFLLTHLKDPARALAGFRQVLRPGGVVVLEDIDFTGYFCYPPSPAHRRYVELYTKAATSRGVDPNIGPRLPLLLAAAGLSRIQMGVVQPMGMSGDAKQIPPITMQTIASAVIAEKHASAEEIATIVADLVAMAADPHTVMGMPRVVQAWGHLAR